MSDRQRLQQHRPASSAPPPLSELDGHSPRSPWPETTAAPGRVLLPEGATPQRPPSGPAAVPDLREIPVLPPDTVASPLPPTVSLQRQMHARIQPTEPRRWEGEKLPMVRIERGRHLGPSTPATSEGRTPAGLDVQREADAGRRGNPAEVCLPLRPPLPVQRLPEWKPANHPDAVLDPFVKTLDEAVDAAATLTKDHPESLDTNLDGYVNRWVETATLLQGVKDGTLDEDDPAVATALATADRFVYAQYGYAIESYTCKVPSNAGKLQGALPEDWSFELQAARGMTRPDIVVKDDALAEAGWFDITSEGQIGHIDKKTGSGWKSKPYVAEVLYPTLDPDEIGTGSLSIGEKVRARNIIKRERAAWEGYLTAKRNLVVLDWLSGGAGLTSKAAKQKHVRRTLADVVLTGHDITPTIAKSLLRALGLDPKEYGFDQGGTKAEGDSLLREQYVAGRVEE